MTVTLPGRSTPVEVSSLWLVLHDEPVLGGARAPRPPVAVVEYQEPTPHGRRLRRESIEFAGGVREALAWCGEVAGAMEGREK